MQSRLEEVDRLSLTLKQDIARSNGGRSKLVGKCGELEVNDYPLIVMGYTVLARVTTSASLLSSSSHHVCNKQKEMRVTRCCVIAMIRARHPIPSSRDRGPALN